VSAFLSICYEDRIELLTDDALYDDDGTLRGVVEKVYRSPRWPLAVTARGKMDFEALNPFLDMLAAASHSAGDFIDRLQRLLDGRHDGGALEASEILIAAFIDEKPVNLYFSTHQIIEGVAPWVIHEMGPEFGGGPSFSLDDLQADGISLASLSAGLEEQGADVMELMRKRKCGNPANSLLPDVYGIGCHVDLTVVRPGGVTTTRLRVWPDVIGEKIDPFRQTGEATAA
jgi:hypothetical protein